MKMSPALFDCGAFLAGWILLLLSGCALRSAPGEAPAQKPPQSRQLVSRSIATLPATQAVTTAHPLATQAALRILDQGGAPIDAAIAAQMVLGLVEPQSSGVGGGSLIMQWDSAARKLTSYDGLAAAPAKVTAGLTIDVDGSVIKGEAVQRGGRSVGVPGHPRGIEAGARLRRQAGVVGAVCASDRIGGERFPDACISALPAFGSDGGRRSSRYGAALFRCGRQSAGRRDDGD